MQLQNQPAADWHTAGPRAAAGAPAWPFPDKIRAAAHCWIIVAAAVYLHDLWQQTAVGWTNGKGRPLGDDFINYWSAAKLATLGRVNEVYNWDAFNAFQESVVGAMVSFTDATGPITFYHYSYPPVLILLTLPLAAVPYVPCLALWLVTGWYAFYRTLRLALPDGALILALAAPAVFINALAGQNGVWTAALLGGGLCLLERKPVIAGILFGLQVYKPHLGILIPIALLAGRQWQAFFAAGITATVALGASVLAFGIDIWFDYLRNTTLLRHVMVDDGSGIWHRMVSVFFLVKRLGAGVELAYAIQAASALITAAIVAYAWWFDAPARLRYSLLVLGIWLATPYLLDYDLVACAFVGAWMWMHTETTHRFPRMTFAVAALAVSAPALTPSLGNISGISIGALFLIPAFALTAYMTIATVRSPVLAQR